MNKHSLLGFKLSHAGRIRVVVGASAICLGWMEYLMPSTSTSSRLDWLKKLTNQMLGDAGFFILLSCVGTILIGWAIVDAMYSKTTNK